MNFFSELGLSESIINEFIDHNGGAILTDIDSNYYNVKTNYELLKLIGIKCLEDLLIYEIDIFMMNTELLKNKLKNISNLEEFVNSVNDDFFNIENII